MAQFFNVHPDNPQPRLIREAVRILREGGVIVYPTDSCYALGCHLGDKEAIKRILQIRQIDLKHHLTLVCHNLSEIAKYAKVDNAQFRLLKAVTPGSYTFILQATRLVPRCTLHPKRATIGLRVPDHKVVLALLEEMGEPILSTTLMLPGDELPLCEPDEIRDRLEHVVDLVIEGGGCGVTPTTVVDLSGRIELVRHGKGDPALLGLGLVP